MIQEKFAESTVVQNTWFKLSPAHSATAAGRQFDGEAHVAGGRFDLQVSPKIPLPTTATFIIFQRYKIFCPRQLMGKGDNLLISSQCQLHVVDKVFTPADTHRHELWMWKLLAAKRR
jgi:hypothetical protein